MAAMIRRGVSTLLSRALPSSSRLQSGLCRSAVAALEPEPAPAPWAVQSRPKTTWGSRPKKNTWPPPRPRPRRKMMWELEQEIEDIYSLRCSQPKPSSLHSWVFYAGLDCKHWYIGMFFSQKPRPPSEDEMVATFIKTIATVVRSEEAAAKRIYNVDIPVIYRGGVCRFGALISSEQAARVKLLPGVKYVNPDYFIDLGNQDYGGDLLVDRKVIRRGEILHEFDKSKFLKEGSKGQILSLAKKNGRILILPGQEQPASQQMSESPQQAQENGTSQQMSENPQQAQENGPSQQMSENPQQAQENGPK